MNTKGKNFLAIVFLGAIALSFLLYGNSIGGNFVYDDKFFAERDDLRESSALVRVWLQPYLPQHREAGTYRPLSIFSFALNFLIFGESPKSFHVVNIILNGFVVFLVFLVVLKLFNRELAILSALIFAFLPIHTEAVAFIKSRDEILSSLFVLLSWLIFLKASENDKKFNYANVLLSSFLLFLAILAKELIIVAPLLFLAVYWLRQRVNFKKIIYVGSVFVPVILVYLLIRYRVLGDYAFGKDDSYFIINPLNQAEFWVRIWTAFKIAFIYIGKTLVPINLSATYHFNQLTLVNNPLISKEVILGIIFLGFLIFLVVYRPARVASWGIGALIFLIPYLVVSKFIFKAGDILGERWMYLPSFGLSLIAAQTIMKIYDRKKLAAILVMVGLAVIYGYLIIGRNKVWLSNRLLFESMVRTAPNSIQGHLNMANLYLDNHYIEEARKEVETGFKIYPDHPPLLNLIGIIAYKDGNYDLAEQAFLRAIQLRPKFPNSYSNIGRLYYNAGHYDKAEQNLQKLIEFNPKPGDVMLLALTLAKLGRYGESLKKLDEFSKTHLDNLQVRFIFAINYYKLGNMAEARKYFDWNKTKSEAEKLKILQNF